MVIALESLPRLGRALGRRGYCALAMDLSGNGPAFLDNAAFETHLFFTPDARGGSLESRRGGGVQQALQERKRGRAKH
jgi:hypothetical protein